jgi:SecD/SecF fusion protein
MKSNMRRIILCVTPLVVALLVLGWAYYQQVQGHGGIRWGVDLSGGTILIYEVDKTKTEGKFDSNELAAALKRRIDPADLFQVTIRPIPADPPRVEIIVPTRTHYQEQAQEEAWQKFIHKVTEKYPVKGKDNPYGEIRLGKNSELVTKVLEEYPKKQEEVTQFINDNDPFRDLGPQRLGSEDIERIKDLISRQGRLEFRILANRRDDQEAINRADATFTEANAAELRKRATLGEPPPRPRPEDGSETFTVTINGEESEHIYDWVEVGKQELYSLRLNSENLEKKENAAVRELVESSRAYFDTTEKKYIVGKPFDHDGARLYSRKIPNPDRIPPKDRELGKEYEYFILVRSPAGATEKQRDENAITGDFLTTATKGYDERGRPEVRFTFDATGGNRFWDLTSRNRREGNFERRLAVILDGAVQSAPGLRTPIRSEGRITSEAFTDQEVTDLVTILRAGALPATLKRQPVSENSMGATLGEDTIRHGGWSIFFAFIAVLVFMMWYYRFAGVVASVALLSNLLLTVAFMILVQATFTLPGLAGLVLTIGIAVDANILIYERIREERDRGAQLSLAIRNGYERAFSTIIDTHLTSIFTAIVLYVVGNDQLKGFGITLTVGLIISLFTALFLTRTIFETWLSRGWLRDLRFHQFFRRPNIDFMRIRKPWFITTASLTIAGAALFVARLDSGVLNIDFVGGTAYTAQLNDPMSVSDLKTQLEFNPKTASEALQQINQQLPASEQINSTAELEKNLGDPSIELVYRELVPQGTKSDLFTLRTTWQNARAVQAYVNYQLGDNLKSIEMKNPQIDVIESGEKKGQARGAVLEAVLEFVKPGTNESDYASRAQVTRILREQFEKNKVEVASFRLDPSADSKEEEGRYNKMHLFLSDPVDAKRLETALLATGKQFKNSPQPERLENFDAQLAADTQERALYAILASWVAILLYLWFRFGNWTFGLACVLCLLHDLFFTLGIIATCHFLHNVPILGSILLLDDFKIDLTTVAALLTLVGYSVNDTIVVFDRIREVRGKNPLLTEQMINDSVNQTLSRTVLSSVTTALVVLVLYIFGGDGIHLFSFVMLIGVIVGTYSSIYIASPLLLMLGEGAAPREAPRPAAQPAATR